MTRARLSRLAAWCVIGVLAVSAAIRAAQVPVTKDPSHRVVFENSQFRILHVSIPPGETTLDHRHEADLVTVSMRGGVPTRAQPSGQAWMDRPPRPLGDVVVTEYTGKAQSHLVQNVGKAAYELFAVENLKPGGWSAAPPLSALATRRAAEGRAFTVYDVQLSRETPQTSHTHAVPAVVVLIAGKVMSDGPDVHAKANAPAPVGLRQLDQTGQWILVPAGDTHHLVRLGTVDARVIEVEVR